MADREPTTPDLDPDDRESPTRLVRQTIELDRDPDRVWALFADAGLLQHWMGRGAALDLRPGGVVAMPDPVSGRPKGGIVEGVDVGRSIELTWWDEPDADGDSHHDGHPVEVSTVRFELEPIVGGTRLTVTETASSSPTGTRSASASCGSHPGSATERSPAATGALWAWRLAVLAVAVSSTRCLTLPATP